jgi:hypothetical protein
MYTCEEIFLTTFYELSPLYFRHLFWWISGDMYLWGNISYFFLWIISPVFQAFVLMDQWRYVPVRKYFLLHFMTDDELEWVKCLLTICNHTCQYLFVFIPLMLPGPSWFWSYGSWIYNYLCNQCLSPLMQGVLDTTSCETCDRSVVFSGYSVFLNQ